MRSLEVGEVSPASQALHLQVDHSMPFLHFRPFRPLNAWSTMACYFQSYDALEHALKVRTSVWLLHGLIEGIIYMVQVAHNYQRQDQLFHKVLHLPVALAAVSEAVRTILQRLSTLFLYTIMELIVLEAYTPGHENRPPYICHRTRFYRVCQAGTDTPSIGTCRCLDLVHMGIQCLKPMTCAVGKSPPSR